MSMYLEIPKLDKDLPLRLFINDGMTIVYPHWHKEIEIIYSCKGKINIGVGNEIVVINENEIHYFASGEPHYFLASPDSERIVCQFDLSIFDETRVRLKNDLSLIKLFEIGEKHSNKWPPELTETIKNILINLYEEYSNDKIGKEYSIFSDLHKLIVSFYRHLPKTKEPIKKEARTATLKYKENLEYLDKIFSYVEKHYIEQITLEDVSKYIGFSPYYFSRFFKTHTGSTFITFLNEYRIKKAKFILANEKISMTDVADKAGFSSVKTFHHVFKESAGMSPLKYQKSISENF